MIKIPFNDESIFGLFKEYDQGLLSTIVIKESAYGEVPTIDITIQSNIQFCKVNEVIEGYLIHPKGLRQDFTMYCYSFNIYNNTQTIKFIMLDPDMLRVVYSYSYNGLIDGIKSTYKGKILSDFVYSDPVSGTDNYGRQIKVYQRNETNLNFCSRCCWSYRFDHLFAYTIEGLQFLDLKNIIYKETVKDDSNFPIKIEPEYMDSKYYSNNTNEVNYSLGNDPNHANITYMNRIIPVNKEYVEMIRNNLHNLRYKTSKLNFTVKTTQLFEFKLLDCIKVESNQLNFTDTFISSRVIEYSKSLTEVTYTMQSVVL